MKQLFPLFIALGLAAAAETHTVTLYQPTQINGKTFKPGDVKLELNDSQVTIKQGKTSTDLQATVQEGAEKFLRTTVGVDGDTKSVKEIRLGGTHKTLSFAAPGKTSGN